MNPSRLFMLRPVATSLLMLALLLVALVPKLQLGNPVSKALALRDGKLELPKLNSQAGAWELANHVHLHHLLFIIFNTRVIYLLRVSWSWTRTLQS